MRRSARRHELIMVAYEQFLQDRVDRGELQPQSMSVNMNHAN
jgi:hypothetical protein